MTDRAGSSLLRWNSTRRLRRRMPQIRSSWSIPILVVLLFGVAMHLGGAAALAVPLWASVALFALVWTGIDPALLRRDRLLQAGLLLIAVSVVQLLPWPGFLLRLVNATSAEATSRALVVLGPAAPDRWRPLHLDPGNGAADLHYLFGLLAAYLASQQLTRRGHGASLLLTATVAPVWMSLLALLHRIWGLDRVLGIYAPQQATPPMVSPILNANHLSAYATAGLLLCMGQAATRNSGPQQFIASTGALLCGLVCALSLSRGGVVAAVIGVLLFVFSVGWIQQKVSKRAQQQWLTAAGLGAFILTVTGYTTLETLLFEFRIGGTTKLHLFRSMFGNLRHHFWLGAGSGASHVVASFSGVLPAEYTMDRIECMPLDLAIAFGVPTALVVLYLTLRWLWNLRPDMNKTAPTELAVFCVVFTLALHDLVDFSLWLGATGYLAACCAGYLAGERAALRAAGENAPDPQGRWLFFALFLASVGAGFYTVKSPLFVDRQIALSTANNGVFQPEALRPALNRHPADAFLSLAGGVSAARHGHPSSLRFLNRSMELSPKWARPHIAASTVLDARGLRNQALLELQLAASLEETIHPTVVERLRSMNVTAEQLPLAIPAGILGNQLLGLAGRSRSAELARMADELLISRDAREWQALYRQASRLEANNEVARARELYTQITQLAPTAPAGYFGMCVSFLNGNALPEAETWCQRGMRSVRPDQKSPLLVRLGELHARRGQTDLMRRAMAQLLEQAGSDIDARIAALGALGSYEIMLHNDLAALSAFEQADAMSHPEHRYAVQLLTIAQRMGDVPRMRGACITLQEYGQPNAEQRALCSRIERSTTAPPTSL